MASKINSSKLSPQLKSIMTKTPEQKASQAKTTIPLNDFFNKAKGNGTYLSLSDIPKSGDELTYNDVYSYLTGKMKEASPEAAAQLNAVQAWRDEQALRAAKKDARENPTPVARAHYNTLQMPSATSRFITERQQEVENAKIGELAQQNRFSVSGLADTSTKFDLPAPSVTAGDVGVSLNSSSVAGAVSEKNQKQAAEDIALAEKYGVSVSAIQNARKQLEAQSVQPTNPELPGISRPFTAEEKGTMAEKALSALVSERQRIVQTEGGARGEKLSEPEVAEKIAAVDKQIASAKADIEAAQKERETAKNKKESKTNLLNDISYVAGSFGLGAYDTMQNLVGGLTLSIGDAVTDGSYSNGFKKLDDYFAKNSAETLVAHSLGSGRGLEGLAQEISNATGVPISIAKAYINSSEVDAMLETLGKNVESGITKKLGEASFSIGQQIPSILVTMGADTTSVALKNISDELVDKVAKTLGTKTSSVALGKLDKAARSVSKKLSSKLASAGGNIMSRETVDLVTSEMVDTILDVLGEQVDDAVYNNLKKAALSATQKIPDVFSKYSTGVAKNKTIKAIADKVVDSVSTLMIGSSVYGSTIQELAKKNGYNGANYLNAALQGSAEALIEKAFGFSDARSFKKLIAPTGSTGKSVLKAITNYIVTGPGGEGLEEVVNAPLSNLIDYMTGVSDYKKIIGEGGIFDLKQMAEAGISGALVGSIMSVVGGTAAIAESVAESGNIQSGFKDLEVVVSALPDAYRPITKYTDISNATAEDLARYEAEVLDGAKRYMDDLANGTADETYSDGGKFVSRAEALEKTISADNLGTVENAAEFVKLFEGEGEDSFKAAIDFITREVRRAELTAGSATTKDIRAEANTNKINYVELKNTIRNNKKEIESILLKGAETTPAESAADTNVDSKTETVESASEAAVESVMPKEEVSDEAKVETAEAPETVPAKEEAESVRGAADYDDLSTALGVELTGNAEEDARVLLDSYRGAKRAAKAVLASATAEGVSDNVRAYGKTLDSEIRRLNKSHAQKAANAARIALKKYGVENVVVDENADDIGVNGYYDRDTNTIHISPYVSEDGAVGRVILHEFTHRGAQADYSLVDAILGAREKLAASGWFEKNHKDLYSREVYEKAYADKVAGKSEAEAKAEIDEEIAAHFMEQIMEDENILEALAREDRTMLQRILDTIRDFFDKGGRENRMAERAVQKIEAVLNKSAAAKSEGVKIHAEGGIITNKNGDAVASDNGNGNLRLSLETYRSGGRDALIDYLENKSDVDMADRIDIVKTLDEVFKICESMTDEYAPFGEWSYAKVDVDEDGNPVLSVIKPNGEYVMNLDFSLVCKKRRTLDAVFNEMIRRGVISNFELGQDRIVKINDIIREHGFEVACAICFVDAKRFRQAKVADDFVKMYNSLVKSMAKNGEKIAYFNFGGDTTLPAIEGGIDTLSDSELDTSRLEKIIANAKNKTVQVKIAQHLLDHPADRKLLSRGDFMSSEGFEAVKRLNPDVLSLYNSKKGSGGPKAAFGDVQYMSDVIKSSKFNAEKAYSVGGVRVQSFSDYVARLVFDYVQMIGDMAAKGLPAHAYTKEALFVKQFGLTGMKINMSLVPAVGDGKYAGLNADGSYAWSNETFDYDTAMEIQSDPEYAKNCGTIAVGISDEHIRKLLADDNIRMVIPYHKSGLNPVVAKMNKIDRFSDYTKSQNTRYANGTKLSKEDAAKAPNFNELLHGGMDAVEASKVYVKWCEDNGYLPKFDQFAYNEDGTVSENYYKLLEDFTTMVDGEYHPQGAVKAVFPGEDAAFGSMESLIREGLKEDAVTQGKRDAAVGDIVDEVVALFEGEDAAAKEKSADNRRESRELSEESAAQFQKDYEADVDAVLSGTFKKNDVLIVGRTPKVLQDIGLAALPVTIAPNHVYGIAKTESEASSEPQYIKGIHYHGLGEKAVKNLLKSISNPIMIVSATDSTDSKKSKPRNSTHKLIVITEFEVDGKRVIAPIEVDAEVKANGNFYDSNHVLSYYDKTNIDSLMREIIARESIGDTAIYYGNKKRIADFVKGPGLQLPDIFKSISDSETIIRDIDENVNRKIKDVTQTQQFARWFGDWQNTPDKASKVVNKDGTPKVVYHYTDSDFTVFDPDKSGDNQGKSHGDGIYVSTSPTEFAYAGKNKMELYVNIRNPFEMELTEKQADYVLDKYASTTHDLDEYDGLYRNHARKKLMTPSRVFDYLNEYAADNGIKTSDILKDLGFDGVHDGSEWVAFDPEQIKSATDNRGTFDKNNPDIRYSRELESEEQRTIRRQQERIDYLSKQLRSHTAFGWAKTVSPTARRDFASEIAAEIPGISTETVSEAIKEVWDIFEAAKKGSSDTAEARVNAAVAKAREVAERIVSESVTNEVNPMYEQYNDLRNRLRNTPVRMTISENEFGGETDYRTWRRGNIGLLRVSDSPDALPIDTFYQELSVLYPEFFPAQIENEADQLKRLGDAAVELKKIAGNKTQVVNPFEDIAESFASDLANRILYGFDRLARVTPGAKHEYGALKNEQDVREAYAEGTADAAFREQSAYERGEEAGRKRNEKEVQAAYEREEIQRQIFERDFREAQNNFKRGLEQQNQKIIALERRIERRSENNRLTMARKQTLATLNRLNTMLTKPNRSKHIPQELRAPVARLLASLGTTRLPNGKTMNALEMLAINDAEYGRFEAECARAADDMRMAVSANRVSADNAVTNQFIDAMTANVERLKQMYAEMNPASPDDVVLLPDLAVSRQIDYIRQVGRILGMVEHYVKDSNVVFLNNKAVSAKEFSEHLVNDLRIKNVKVQKNGEASRLREFISGVGYEFVSADLFFEMMGESGVELMREYRRGQTRQAAHEQEFADYMLEVTGGKYSTHDVGFNGELIPLSISSNGLKVTKSQLMQLYITWKRPAGRRHLMSGGAVFTNEVGQEAKINTIRITQDIYDDLIAHLSDEDKKVADAIGSFLSKRCAEWGNEASMKMYGYRMFEDPFYFPLDVSKNVLPANWDSLDEFYRLENAGMTKTLKSDASAPLRMTDIFDIADHHVRTMAAYSAFAPVSNDVQRIMNMPNVREAVNHGMGKKGVQYLDTLMKTIASNKVRNGDMSDAAAPLQFFMNAYKRQAVAFNLSTAIKQPLSIVRALNEIDGKYIRQAPAIMAKAEYQRIYDTMLEHSGVAKMKMLGFSDTGFAKSMRQIYDTDYTRESGVIRGTLAKTKGGRNAVKAYDKITDAGMWAAGKMDEVTWVRLWKACELEVADKFKGLSQKDAVVKTAERFNEIIGRTQVVDTILDTSPLMRNNAMSILTPFMSEPTKALATIITAADAVRDRKSYGKQKLRKAVGLVMLNNLVLEPIISTLLTMWKDEEDDTENLADFAKKFLKLYAGVNIDDGFTFTEFATSNAVSGAFSFPIVQIFYDTFADSAQNYSNEKVDTAALTNLIKNTKNLLMNLPKAKEDRAKSNYKLFIDFLGSAAAAVGIPLPTLRRQVSALYRTALNLTDSYELQWEYNKMLYNMENSSARSQKNFYDIMAAAYKAGDTEAYNKMRRELAEIVSDTPSVISPKSIEDAIVKRGAKIETGTDLWYVDLQARFYLEKFVPQMKAERLITEVYAKADKKKLDAGGVLLNMPSVYEYENKDGEEKRMTTDEYDEYIHDVGLLSYQVLVELASTSRRPAWSSLTLEQQIYAIEQAYKYSKAKFKADFNPDYNINSQGKWMTELYSKNAGQSEIASTIISRAKAYEG